jgi:hypothetical protein
LASKSKATPVPTPSQAARLGQIKFFLEKAFNCGIASKAAQERSVANIAVSASPPKRQFLPLKT